MRRRISALTTTGAVNENASIVDDLGAAVGPKRIRLHSYCHEPGLASYVWHRYLRAHVCRGWEGDSCRGRLSIHVHLTRERPAPSPSISSDGAGACAGGERMLADVPDAGVADRIDFLAGGGEGPSPVRDACFLRSAGLQLLLPGLLVTAGTAAHWWWYTQYGVPLFRVKIYSRLDK